MRSFAILLGGALLSVGAIAFADPGAPDLRVSGGAVAADPQAFLNLPGSGSTIDAGEVASEVKAELIVLHATNDGKGIDPGIGKIPALEKPPFSAYNSYKLMERSNLKLPKGEEKAKDLPDGGQLLVTYKDMLKGKKKEDPDKFVLSASINKPDKKPLFPGVQVNAAKGEWFFLAGPKYKDGILVIGIKVP